MSNAKTIRPQSTPIQRLSSRLLRRRGYSLGQISALVGLSAAIIHYMTVDTDGENLENVTLQELGAPGNKALFDALLAATKDFTDQRLALRQVGEPRGNLPFPTSLTAIPRAA